MTINKIAFSALTAAMLTTAAFSADVEGTYSYVGDLNPGDHEVTVATELANAAVSTIDVNNLDPDNNGIFDVLYFKPSIDGSTTVSDPTFNYIFPGDYTVPPLSAVFTVGVSAVTDSDLAGADLGLHIALLHSMAYDSTTNTTKLTFKGDSSDPKTVKNGHLYFLTDDVEALGFPLTPMVINVLLDQDIEDVTYSVELWSTSGTEERRSYADITPFLKVPQYEVTCVSKLDGMINFENASLTFVPTQHGLTQTSLMVGAPFSSMAIFDQDRDAFTFSITNHRGMIMYYLNGKGTHIDITGQTNNISAIPAAVGALTIGGAVAGDLTIPAPATLRYTLANQIPFVNNGVVTTTYTAYAVADLTNRINENVWLTNVLLNAGGFPAVDQNPAINYPANPAERIAGEWNDYVYIAQIAGATQTSTTKTKLFVVNRSCTDVTPEMKLIKDGVVTTVTLAPIAVNAQSKMVLGDILAANGLDEGQYAIELTLPGNAEDFYVYAQAFNAADGITKDLPVYNTSTRD